MIINWEISVMQAVKDVAKWVKTTSEKKDIGFFLYLKDNLLHLQLVKLQKVWIFQKSKISAHCTGVSALSLWIQALVTGFDCYTIVYSNIKSVLFVIKHALRLAHRGADEKKTFSLPVFLLH